MTEHTASTYDPNCGCEWCDKQLNEGAAFLYALFHPEEGDNELATKTSI